MGCTTLLVGRNASYDGSTIMARNEDSGGGTFDPKKFIVVNPEEQPREYRSVLSKFAITLPDNPMRYTAMPNAIDAEGIWGEAGFNEANVAMTETETITSNPRVLGADPLVPDGIGEEDMLTIVLPYIRSAREGVLRLGALLEQYGTYEMNGIGFQDVNEIWWMETIGGHHWIARRVPDDEYVVMPNQMGIDTFDLDDAFGEKRENLCSEDMLEFIGDNHLDCGMHDEPLEMTCEFDARAAFGSRSDADHCYNTPRAWYMERYLTPHTYDWDGPESDRTPESDDIPWSLHPNRKITIEDIKYVLSSHYQGTDYDPYSRHADPRKKGMYRVIGVNRNNFLAITQIRPYVPQQIACVEWIAEGSNVFNTVMPFYGNVTDTPLYLSNTTKVPDTVNFYWVNRIIGALADAHYGECIPHIERYQLKMASRGHELLRKYDGAYIEAMQMSPSARSEEQRAMVQDVSGYLTQCNDEIAAELQEATDDLLDKVLYTASLHMKNAYARSDN